MRKKLLFDLRQLLKNISRPTCQKKMKKYAETGAESKRRAESKINLAHHSDVTHFRNVSSLEIKRDYKFTRCEAK